MFKVVVAGSREFEDYTFLEKKLNHIFSKWHFSEIEIVSGGAKGVDHLGEMYAQAKGCALKVFPADWEKHGKAAGPIRNKEMAEYATHLVAFWDGESRGTKNMIDTAKKLGLKIRVIEI
jgi:hypothetical protein